jgi:signal transduction histidine kinase
MANELGADSTLAGVAMEICRSALAVLGSEATSLVIGQASWAGSAWVCGGDGVAMRYPEVVGLEGWGGGEWEVRVLGLDDGRLGGLRSWLESKGMTLSHYAPILRGSDCMGYLGLHHRDGASRVWELDPALFRGATELAALALVRAMSLEELKKQGEQLRLLAAKAVEVEDAERRRISSDLHDLAGQHLAALGFQLQLMESRLPAECREVEGPALRDMHASVQLLGGVLRGVMADLRPLISEEGLLGSFRACAMPVSRRTGLRVEVEGEDPVKRLGPAAEGALVRIVQEALENAARHGGAKRATVVLQRQGESGWVLEVADDGCGFDPAELGQRSERPRLGMVAMRERALALNASFEVLTAPGQGVRVRVRRKAPA